jgi:GntR family transcriptional repressor for pyruvate dehydrogenase complex
MASDSENNAARVEGWGEGNGTPLPDRSLGFTGRPIPGAASVSTTARSAVFSRLGSGDRVEAVAERLSAAISLGVIEDGEQLPRETDLAASLGVSTVTLREALSKLRARGMIQTRRGRGGGSFARLTTPTGTSMKRRMQQWGAYGLRDLGDQHCAVFGMACRRAAERASHEHLVRLHGLVEALESAVTPVNRRRADGRFAVEIAAAAQSAGFTKQMIRLQQEFADLAWLPSPKDELDDNSFLAKIVAGMRAILDAVTRGDADEAASLAESQIDMRVERIVDLHFLLNYPPPSRRSESANQKLRSATDSAAHIASQISASVGSVFKSISAIRERVATIFHESLSAGRKPHVKDLQPLESLLNELLQQNEPKLLGAGFIAEPGVLIDAERWIEWRAPGENGIRSVKFDLTEGGSDSYDYPFAAWFSEPRNGAARTIVGPYVDVGGIDAYTVTLSIPVQSAGQFVGVAGADLSLGLVESVVRRMTRAARLSAAVLVTKDARILASNVRGLYPGSLLRGAGTLAEGGEATNADWVGYKCEGLPWTLLVPANAVQHQSSLRQV